MAVTVSGPPKRESGDRSPPKIAFFHSYWTVGPSISLGASDYWRLALPAAELYRNGWDVCLARNVAAAGDGTLHVQEPSGQWRGDREIIVWGQWMSEGTAEQIHRARAMGQVIINDIDDDYWSLPAGHVARNFTDPQKRPEYNRTLYLEALAASSLVTTSTPHLVKRLKELGVEARLIRNFIDIDAWPQRPPGDHVGWIGMLPWRDADLKLLQKTVVPWLRERGQFFYHGGTTSGDKRSAEEILEYDLLTTRPSAPIETYPLLWDPLRVALVPMRDSAFNRSKSWNKGLEAMARGVPFIASAHAEYEALDAPMTVKKPGDWARHLSALEDPLTYEEHVRAGRLRAEELTIQKNWTAWASLFQEARSLESHS